MQSVSRVPSSRSVTHQNLIHYPSNPSFKHPKLPAHQHNQLHCPPNPTDKPSPALTYENLKTANSGEPHTTHGALGCNECNHNDGQSQPHLESDASMTAPYKQRPVLKRKAFCHGQSNSSEQDIRRAKGQNCWVMLASTPSVEVVADGDKLILWGNRNSSYRAYRMKAAMAKIE